MSRRAGSARRRDEGSAVAEFVMVSALVLALFVVVFQAGLALHTRNVLVSVAAEGARYAANADVSSEALVRARVLDGIETAFTPALAARSTVNATETGGIVEVEIRAPLPLAFVPSPIRITVRGHAYEEGR
ncbi:MAG: TadE family protein [Frankiales bacterium]|nr:TadE family protein [Frankiales bacterium]